MGRNSLHFLCFLSCFGFLFEVWTISVIGVFACRISGTPHQQTADSTSLALVITETLFSLWRLHYQQQQQ
jgi:hypothetical protein